MHEPLNSLAWTSGAISIYTFAFRSWRSHRRTKNPLARMYYVLGTTFGTALFFFGVPGLVSDGFLRHLPTSPITEFTSVALRLAGQTV
jgi:hypothetical protein